MESFLSALAEQHKKWPNQDGYSDWDSVEFLLAKSLGVLPEDADWFKHKGLFWSANPIGDGLGAILEILVRRGFLDDGGGHAHFKPKQYTGGELD